MTSISIAAAQSPSIAGDVEQNLQTHLKFIEAARDAGVDILLFPELSLTGYELPLMRACAMAPDDARLAPIRAMAADANMSVIVGAPLTEADAMPSIAALRFTPDGAVSVYRKQYLHAGEDRYAQAGGIAAHRHRLNGHAYALAICADTLQRAHAAAARSAGAALYLAGVLISEAGYASDAAILQRHAAELGMGVLIANHAAPSGGYASAGRSAFWNPQGELVVDAGGPGQFLVIARHQDGRWSGETVAVL